MAERRDHRGGRGTSDGSVGQYLGHGLTWAGATILFLLGGRELDRWVGTEPLFTLLGAFVGAAAGFWSMYYHLVIEPRERERRAKRGDGPPEAP